MTHDLFVHEDDQFTNPINSRNFRHNILFPRANEHSSSISSPSMKTSSTIVRNNDLTQKTSGTIAEPPPVYDTLGTSIPDDTYNRMSYANILTSRTTHIYPLVESSDARLPFRSMATNPPPKKIQSKDPIPHNVTSLTPPKRQRCRTH